MGKESLRTCANVTELMSLPYAKRQVLVVVDDEVFETVSTAQEATKLELQRKAKEEAEKREAKRKEEENEKNDGDDSILEKIISLIPRPNPKLDVAPRRVVQGLSKLIDRDDELDVLIISYSTAASLKFPAGHPRSWTLYVGHPTVPNRYYTTADFHRQTFEHKFAEAVGLLMALGATRISVERVSGWSQEFAAQLDATGSLVEGKGGRSKKSGSRLLFEASLDGTREPVLPDGMVWYPYEPAWQSIAEGRLKYGIQNFNLSMEYTDDYDINAKLKVKASRLGLDLGGKFTEFQETIWHIEGDFTDVPPERLAEPSP